MKSSSFVIALMGAVLSAGLVPSSLAREQVEPVRVKLDVDRSILPADTPERAVIKVGLDCDRPPRRDLLRRHAARRTLTEVLVRACGIESVSRGDAILSRRWSGIL